MPRVSVVIPCYNAERHIEAAVRSILDQTFSDFEVIVVDDGSTDRSAALVRSLADARLRLLSQSNAGPSAARNTAVAAARGQYIAFLDADDVALPHRLAEQAAVLDADPDLAAVASGYVWIDEADREIPAVHSWELPFDLSDLHAWLFDCPLVPSATMLRRAAFQAVGGFDPTLRGGEDWHLWMRLVLAGHRFAWHRRVVTHYRRRAGGLSADGERMVQDCTRVLRDIMAQPAFPAALRDAGRQALALRYVDGTKRQFAAGLWREGRGTLADAIALDPQLIAGFPSRIELELLNVALDPLVSDPVAFLATAFDFLPENARGLRERRDRSQFLLELARFDRALRRRAYRAAASHALLALAEQPALILDRRAWSSAWRLLGGALRAATGRLRPAWSATTAP